MLSMPWIRGVIIRLISSSIVMPALGQAEDDPWMDFRFLIGTWASDGKPEEGTGGFTLEADLQGKILVRRNRLDLPAAQGRPAARHEDLMVIYRMPDGKRIRASYYDNEDHVIQYTVSSLPDRKGLVFVSDAGPSTPRFRLTYTAIGQDTVAVRFEIAPSGKPDEFTAYLKGTAHRKMAAN
jgi:hypothetical protein